MHLNTFIGRDAIEAWTRHLGMKVIDIRAASDPFVTLSRPIIYDSGERAEVKAALGQSVCLISNDKPALVNRPQEAQPAFKTFNFTFR